MALVREVCLHCQKRFMARSFCARSFDSEWNGGYSLNRDADRGYVLCVPIEDDGKVMQVLRKDGPPFECPYIVEHVVISGESC